MIDKNDSKNDPFNDPQLTAYAMGELSADEARRVEQLIADSPELTIVVDEIRATIVALEGAFADEQPLELSEEQKLAIESAAESGVADSDKVSPAQSAVAAPAKQPWLRWVMAAGIATLLVGGSVFLSNADFRERVTYFREGVTARLQDRVRTEALGKDEGTKSPIEGKSVMAAPIGADAPSVAKEDFAPMMDMVQSTIESDEMLREETSLELEVMQSQQMAGAMDESESLGARANEDTELAGESARDKRPQRMSGVMAPSSPEALGRQSGGMSGDGVGMGGGGAGGGRASGQRQLANENLAGENAGSQPFQPQAQPMMEGMAMSDEMSVYGDAGGEEADGLGGMIGRGGGGMGGAAPAPAADLSQRFSGMEFAANGLTRTEDFPNAEEWLEKRRSRARFSRQRLADGYQDESGVVGQFEMEGSDTAKQSTNSFLENLLELNDDGEADEAKTQESDGRKLGEAGRPKFDDKGRPAIGFQTGENLRVPLSLLRRLEENTSQGQEEDEKQVESEKELSRRPAKPRTGVEKKATKTWKRVKAIPNTTRLMVGDKEELDLTGMQVNVQVDGFRARVLIDYLYYNDRDRQLEGNFKLRLPEDSSLYYFAFGESANELTPQRQLARREFANNGTQFVSFTPAAITKSRSDVWRNVKEARMVPREQAAYAFRETVRRRVDPALVEWSGAGVFNAKVFPLAPKKVHRIVIGYDVNLTRGGNQLTYQLNLPESTGDCRIEINAQDVEGIQYQIEPEVEPVEVDHNDELHQRFTFEQRPENGIRLTATTELPLLLKSKELADEFWATQITPDLPVQESVGSGRAMFMLDTSLSSSPDKFNVWLKMLETTLANNRDTMKEFGVLMFSVDGHFWKPNYVANTADNLAELKGTLENLVLEGATDLYAAVQKVTMTDWVVDGEAPDLFLLSDGAANWGETNQRLIGSLLSDKKTGSLFAYQTGMTGTAIANLRFLAGQTGGAVFSVASEDEVATASTAHRKRPWKLSAISAEGATDVMTAGRVEWVYPGQALTVVGRGVVSGPMKFEFEQSGKTMSVSAAPKAIVSELAGRLYGQISVGQLESIGSEVFDISAAYARHFRITGGTCSLLMLESEADYERFDIKPEEDEFVIKSKPASKLVAGMLEKAASHLADPKAQLLAWLKRLETMQGLKFAMPTALKLAIDDINVVAVSRPLDCTVASRGDVSKGYLNALGQESLDYDVIAGQAKKRGRQSADDSIKVFSSLIERSPGDVTMARDVAFTALELDRPAQAYHLLRRVASQRPFQGSVYPAIGQCLAQAGQADMAIVYYEVALAGEFQRQGSKFRQIVAVDYMHLLRQIVSEKAESSVIDFARARLETLTKKMPVSKADMLVTMMWNQDQTDVDLHVIEPSGEECFYKHKKTKSGGEITDDITTGFGPEMYFNETAPDGTYKITVKFFGNSQNRTSVKNKVYLSVFEGFGSDQETVTRRTIRLKDAGEHRTVMEVVK